MCQILIKLHLVPLKITFSQSYLYLNFLKAFQFSVNLHYFKIVIQNRYYSRNQSSLQSLELSRTAELTGGEIIVMASLMTASAQPTRLWDFFSSIKGGDAKGPLQINLYLSNLEHILFHRISSNISEQLLQGKASRFEWNRAISQDISIRLQICTINGEVNENKFPPRRTSCESAFQTFQHRRVCFH